MNNKNLLKRALKIQHDNAKNKVLKTIGGVCKILQLLQTAIVVGLVETNPVIKARYIGDTGRTDAGLLDLFSEHHENLKPNTIVNLNIKL